MQTVIGYGIRSWLPGLLSGGLLRRSLWNIWNHWGLAKRQWLRQNGNNPDNKATSGMHCCPYRLFSNAFFPFRSALSLCANHGVMFSSRRLSPKLDRTRAFTSVRRASLQRSEYTSDVPSFPRSSLPRELFLEGCAENRICCLDSQGLKVMVVMLLPRWLLFGFATI